MTEALRYIPWGILYFNHVTWSTGASCARFTPLWSYINTKIQEKIFSYCSTKCGEGFSHTKKASKSLTAFELYMKIIKVIMFTTKREHTFYNKSHRMSRKSLFINKYVHFRLKEWKRKVPYRKWMVCKRLWRLSDCECESEIRDFKVFLKGLRHGINWTSDDCFSFNRLEFDIFLYVFILLGFVRRTSGKSL